MTSTRIRGRFVNPWGRHPMAGLRHLLQWKLGARPAPWPTWVEDPLQPEPPDPGHAESVITFINHATLLIRTRTLNLLTDPVFSERTSPVSWAGPRRIRRPGLDLDRLPPIHGILLSHNHYDHLDATSLRALQARHRPWILAPLGVGGMLRSLGMDRVTELDWWQTVEREGHRITCTPPAQHFSGRGLFDRNRSLWGGFVVDGPGPRVYFAGDTGYAPFFHDIRERCGAPDLALLPIGAYAPRWFMSAVHMDPSEAVRAHLDLGAARSVGIHWGTWQLTDEGLEEPLRELEAARTASGLPPEAFQVLEHGGSLLLR
ncbi:MAG TPA: MBL fold metallo-hydrolase [Holophagaceae bacterium]|nr:MBL fold metallo-hydrolase [Holophagaceae bacterium]